MRRRAGVVPRSVFAVLAVFFASPALAPAATLVVAGERLTGEIEGVTAAGVRFAPAYGKGAVEIPYERIERVQSEAEFVVLFDDTGEARGRLLGVRDGRLLVGTDEATAARVPVGGIQRALPAAVFDGSSLERFRARHRHWSGGVDLAFSSAHAASDSLALHVGAEARRQRGPSRLTLGGFYRLGTEQEAGRPSRTTENRLVGHLRLDRDLTERLFGFGGITGEYDEVQRLSLRTVPTLGVAYRLFRSQTASLALRAGGGYVHERFFDETSNDFATALFGADVEAALPFDSTFEAGLEYLPAVDDWADNYRLRASAAWRIPLLGWLDLKFTVQDDYTSRPAPGTSHNSLATLAGIALRF